MLTAYLQELSNIENIVLISQFATFEKINEFSKRYNIPLSCHNYKGISPLITAVIAGNTDAVKGLLALGINVNEKAYYLLTEVEPIHIAAIAGQVEILDILAKNGADINKKTENGETPIVFAIRADNLAAVKKLVELGVDISKVEIPMAWSSPITPLKYAQNRGLKELAEYFISIGVEK